MRIKNGYLIAMFAAALIGLGCIPLAACASPSASGVTSAGSVAATTAATTADALNVPAPVTFADRTVLDEQAITAVELAYKAERLALDLAIDAGVVKGARAVTIADLDNRAYAAVNAARAAYATANAASYRAAVTDASTAVAAAVAAIKGN